MTRICLQCGVPGCGRYAGAHSLEHYLNTNHNFSVNYADKIIWSYATDNFVHRVKEKSHFCSRQDGDLETRALERQDNLLEQNVSSMLCEQLDMQRAHFENKLEAKREELNREVIVTADLKAKDLSLTKELVKKELEMKKSQYSTVRKARFALEQKLDNVKRLLEEEEVVRNNLESHVAYIETEDDPVLANLDIEIASQTKLLGEFEKKLFQMYENLS